LAHSSNALSQDIWAISNEQRVLSFKDPEFNGPISAIDTFYTYANNALKDPKAVQTGYSSKANSAKPLNRETKEYIDKIFDLKIPLHRRLAVFKAISIGFGLRGGEV